MKKYLIALYITGAFLTNSYVRQYRIDEWENNSIKELRSYQPTVYVRDVEDTKRGNNFCCFVSTVLWPAYIFVRISDIIICTNVKVEAPEILK